MFFLFPFFPFISSFILYRPEQFNGLLQRLWSFKASKLASFNVSSTNQLLERLSANIQRVDHFEFRFNKSQLIWILNHVGPFTSISYCNSEIGQSACWVPFDIFMENAMDGRQLMVRSAIAILTGNPSRRAFAEFFLSSSLFGCLHIFFVVNLYFLNK